MRLTVGQLPSAVYWRRRAIVLGALLLLVILTVWACGGSGGTTKKAATHRKPSASARPGAALPSVPVSDSPTSDPSTSATPGTEPGADGAVQPAAGAPAAHPAPVGSAPRCTDHDLSVTTRTATRRIPDGSYPTLYLTIGNTSSHACTRDLGADQQELWITQGKKRIWSSNDCHPNHGKDVRRFGPGDRVTFHLIWDGKTSHAGCTRARRVVPRGTYQLRGRVGSKTSEPTDFTLT